MFKSISLSFVNCLLILLTVLLHKILYRVMLWDYESLIMYWGIFVAIFLVLNILSNLVFLQPRKKY